MSRTNKTTPIPVRMHRGEYPAVAVHNHERGECNLPDVPPAVWPPINYGEDCYWEQDYDGRGTCGCPMCTSKDERRTERRRQRHGARAQITEQLFD